MFPPSQQAAPAGPEEPHGAMPMEPPGQIPGMPPPEEAQVLYAKIVDTALQIMYADEFFPGAQERLQEQDDPVPVMAEIASMIAVRIYAQAASEGEEIPAPIFIDAGVALIHEVAELAEAVGKDVGVEDIEDAFLLAAETTREALINMGLVDRAELEEQAAEVRKTMSLDEFQKGAEMMDRAKGRASAAMGIVPPGPPETMEGFA